MEHNKKNLLSMLQEKYSKNTRGFPAHEKCAGNKRKGINYFWRKEIEQQYEYYIASLRACRDVSFLVQEHDSLLKRLEISEANNVELRKKIRLLELELMTMYQRNAHDSCVIDALQEVDHTAEEASSRTSEVKQEFRLKQQENDTHKNINNILSDQISLLSRKVQEDGVVLDSLKPREKRLGSLLDSEKHFYHLQSVKFKEELQELLKNFEQKMEGLNSAQEERKDKTTWLCEMFCKNVGREMELLESELSSETNSTASTQETEKFDVDPFVPSSADIIDIQNLDEEKSRFIAATEICEKENSLASQLIYNYLSRFEERIASLIENYLSVYKITGEISLMKEYIERLHLVRKKQEHKVKVTERELVEQMRVMFDAHMSEQELLKSIIYHFLLSIKEEFQFDILFSFETKELFTAAINS